MPAQRHRRLCSHLDAQVGEVVGPVGQRSGQQLVQAQPEPVDVGAVIHVLGRAHLLGRHVQARAEHGRGVGQGGLKAALGLAHHLGDAEVDDLEQGRLAGALHQEQVRGLDVAMHDADPVCLGQPLGALHGAVQGVLQRELPALLQERGEVVALEKLHDDEGQPVRQLIDIHHPRHVLAVDAVGGLGFAHEAPRQRTIGHVAREQEFQGHARAERAVVARHDRTHAPDADGVQHAVLAEQHRARGNAGDVEPGGQWTLPCGCQSTSAAAVPVDGLQHVGEHPGRGHGRPGPVTAYHQRNRLVALGEERDGVLAVSDAE